MSNLFTPTIPLFFYCALFALLFKKTLLFLVLVYPCQLQRLPNSLHSIYPCFIQGLVSIFIILSSHLLNLPFSHPVIFIPFLFIYRCYNMLYLQIPFSPYSAVSQFLTSILNFSYSIQSIFFSLYFYFLHTSQRLYALAKLTLYNFTPTFFLSNTLVLPYFPNKKKRALCSLFSSILIFCLILQALKGIH